MSKNWIVVASAEHARRGRDHGRGVPPGSDAGAGLGSGVAGCGFMQVGHGKLAPLRRIKPGDRVAYYAPATQLGGTDRLQSFVSIGIVQAGEPYAFDMGGGFVPYRRDVRYLPSHETLIAPLLDAFEFVEDRARWGYKFRFGLFEVSPHDMGLIAEAMGAALPPA